MSTKKQSVSYITDISYPYSKSWDKNATNVKFEIESINVGTINAIRRTIISQIKTFAFRTEPHDKNDIQIIKNETALNNQIICHRIGMIPIHIYNIDFKMDDYEFIIDVVNDTNFPKTITSKDIKILKISTNTYLSKEDVEHIFPKDPITGDYIIIVKLKPCYNIINYKLNSYKDELLNAKGKLFHFNIKAKASLSNGFENSRYSPVTAISYTYKINEEKVIIAEKEYIASEIQNDKEKELTPKTEEELSRYFQTTLKERYFYDNEEGEPTKFMFNLESVGVIPPLVIFHRGIQNLIEKVNTFLINLKTSNENVITINASPNIPDGYQFTILNEDDTLGNLIQENFFNKFCDNGELDYIGYKRVHPLEDKIIINILSSKYKDIDSIINNIFVHGCNSIIKHLKELQSDLEKQKEFVKELKSIKPINF
jgi:DNA-directed RNA polymerase subunit L/DNA-directed RNA polymerase alpha subunit